MTGFGDLFGEGSTARQLFTWQVLGQTVTTALGPAIIELQSLVQAAVPDVPLSPAESATAANRSFLTEAAGAAEAAKSGISPERFAVLQDLAGDAPSPTDLVTGLRRGLIPRDGTGPDAVTFAQGIAEGNLRDKWTDFVAHLAVEWPSPAVAADAALKGQVTPEEGKALYEKFGGDPQWFDLVHNTEGSAPTPEEAVGMALRGIIPWAGTGPAVASYEQAFLEGPWRDKWQPAFQAAALWWPTIGETVELYRWGKVSREVAAEWLTRRGLTAEQAAAWLGYAEVNAVDDYRGLTETSVLSMLAASYITDEQARTMLAALHKGSAAVDALISYAHVQRAISTLSRSVDRIGTLYQGRKISEDTARNALVRLHLPATSVDDVIADWAAVASVNVKTLTESQVADAWEREVMTQDEAMTELENIGYTPFDAWVLLSVKNKAPLPGKPARGPAPPLGTVTPGTT